MPKNVFVKHGNPARQETVGPTTHPLFFSRGQGLTLLLTVPKLHSTHRPGEVMAWQGNAPLPKSQQPCPRPPCCRMAEKATGHSRSMASVQPHHYCPACGESAAGDSPLRSAALLPPAQLLLPTAFMPGEQNQEIQKWFQSKNSYPSQTPPVLTKLLSQVSSGTAPGPQPASSVPWSISAVSCRAWHRVPTL